MIKTSGISVSLARTFCSGKFTIATLDGGDPLTSLYYLHNSALANLPGSNLTGQIASGDFKEIWGVMLKDFNWTVDSTKFKMLERISKPRGGVRPGSGAPRKEPTSLLVFRVPDSQKEAIREKVKELIREMKRVKVP